MQELVIVKNIIFFKWNIRHTFFDMIAMYFGIIWKKKPKVRNSTIYNKTYLDKSLTTLHLKKSNSCISVVVNTLIMLQ